MTDLSGSNLRELLTEAEVVADYPMITRRELRRARESKSIRYLKANREGGRLWPRRQRSNSG